MVMGGDLMGGEHTTQCADGVLWSCAPETCIISLTCHPNKFNKKKERMNRCSILELNSS